MKKIVIDKDEDIADVIDHILEFPDTGIVIVLPRGSVVGRSPRNFHLLRREAEAAGRQLEIESVDEQILAFAKDAGIPGRHPLFTKADGGNVSDIVAVTEKSSAVTVLTVPSEGGKKKSVRNAKFAEPAVKIEVREEEGAMVAMGTADDNEERNEMPRETPRGFFDRGRFFKDEDVSGEDGEDNDRDGDDSESSRRRAPWRWIGVTVGIIIIAAILFFGVTRFFGHAQVNITFVKTPWQYQAVFTADKSVAKTDLSNRVIPAQVFFETKNVTQLFPASGNANVKTFARGAITIYNAYSSAPQDLVATTRFATPDGKIFRLVSSITVPGAKVANGQITPSSIDTTVVADQPGPDGNVGPVAKLLIPGFQKSAKYNGFYGVMASGTTGGFVGLKAVPTAQDVTNAKASTTAILQSAIQSATGLDVPSNFKILDGASNVQIARLTVNTSTDQSGKFSVFGQVTFQAIGFEEPILSAALLSAAQTTEASSSFSALDLSYTNVKPDFTNGRVSFSATANASLAPAFAVDDFKTGIAGTSIANARAAVAALPQLQDGTISVWPVWLWTIPTNSTKIDVTVN